MKRRDFLKSAVAAVTGASAAVKAAGAKKIMVEHEPEMAPEIKDIPPEMSMGLFMSTNAWNYSNPDAFGSLGDLI